MSENYTDGFGAPPPEPQAGTVPAGRNQKMLVLGGVGLAVVAAAGAFVLLSGGGDSATPAAGKPTVPHVVPTATATPTVLPVGKPTPAVRTFNGDVGRDPFAALITSPPAPTTSAAPSPTGTVPVAAPTTSGAVVGPTGTLPGGLPVLPTLPAAPTTTPPPAVTVVLKAISFHGQTPVVQVSLSGKSYTLKTGDTVGSSLKVLDIEPDDGNATFQLGEQPFDLHIGQTFVD